MMKYDSGLLLIVREIPGSSLVPETGVLTEVLWFVPVTLSRYKAIVLHRITICSFQIPSKSLFF